MRVAASRERLREAAPLAREHADGRFAAVREGFDNAAAGYDSEFTDSPIGRLQREAVWRQLDALFLPGQRVLDLGCGTGADAIHLARRGVKIYALDVSERMHDAMLFKVFAAGVEARVTSRVAAIEELNAAQFHGKAFDGAISNFAALNCVEDLRSAASTLGEGIRPGGRVAICLISRFCLWESAYYTIRGQFAKACRRWKNRGATSGSVGASAPFAIYYRGVREVAEAFSPEFRLRSYSGIGLFVPPSYVQPRIPGWSELLKLFSSLDRWFSAWPLFRGAADHVLLIFTREHQL